MNTPVSFELAKLLKEKGFDEVCNNHYSQALFEGTKGVFPKYSVFKHSDYHYNSKPNNNDLWFECSAPTISEVVMWLYEKHGIWITVKLASGLFWWEISKTDKNLSPLGMNKHTPTEAYEAAIAYFLTRK